MIMFLKAFHKFIHLIKKKDFPRKKVLILEGGGMRGVFLAGVLQAFTDYNYFPWKLIIGSSAGALVGTAYAAHQIHRARDAYFSKLLTKSFIHYKNIFSSSKHILDLDWMVDIIFHGDEELDYSRISKFCRILITATHCPPNALPETIYLDNKKDDIITALKATAAIPFLYKGFIPYKNFHLLDGGLIDPIPFQKALDLGYKDDQILVILTREKGYRKKEESFWIRSLYEKYYNNKERYQLVKSLEKRYLLYNKILDDLELNHPEIDIIYPPKDFRVERLTQDPDKILEGFEAGIHQAKRYLNLLKI